jgi:hypothetical protein
VPTTTVAGPVTDTEVGADAVAVEKAATIVYDVEAEPRVSVADCGPAAVARMSSRFADALPFWTSIENGTPWLEPGTTLPG